MIQLRSRVPVDTKRQDWGRLAAQDINGLVRAYMFQMWFLDTPEASQVLWLHPCGASFSIPANWGERIENGATRYAAVEQTCDVHPTSTFTTLVYRKLFGSSSYDQIGTWAWDTSGVFTATTTGGGQIDCARGDVLKWVGPVSPDATIAQTAVTLIGFR